MQDVLHFMNEQQAIASAKKAALETYRLRWTTHVKQRMHERGILIEQVLTCLEKGHVVRSRGKRPHRNVHNEWAFEMSCITAGMNIELAVAVSQHENVTLITVYEVTS